MLDYLKINKSEAIAFGDSGNDIDMLEYVGLGIAMENGDEWLKQKADFVQGISKLLKKFASYTILILDEWLLDDVSLILILRSLTIL